MSEVRVATDEEIAELGFPDFGDGVVETVWNESADVAYSRYSADKVKVTNLLDYRNTPDPFLRSLANDAAKIMGTRVTKDLLRAGHTQLYIPVEEEILRPGRTGGKRGISFDRMLVLLRKERDGELTEDEAEIMAVNAEKIQELRDSL